MPLVRWRFHAEDKHGPPPHYYIESLRNFLENPTSLGPVYTVDHEIGPLVDGLFPWANLMVQLP